MTVLKKLWCWWKGFHTDPILMAVNKSTSESTWLCRSCLKVWREKETTGRHDA